MARPEQPDFLDRMVAEREAKSPGFAKMVDDAYRRRVMGRALAAGHQALGLSQTAVARRMKTCQPAR